MFRIGEEYQRNALLDFVGSRQLVSGMIYGDKERRCVIVTSGGKHGEEAGYSDKKNADGSWIYIGQGSDGNQNPYSKANSYLTNGEKTVLLFSTREPSSKEARSRGSRQKFYKFEGVFEVGSWDFVIPNEGKRNGNQLVQYHLIPAENIFADGADITNIAILRDASAFHNLRKKIKNQETKPPKGKRTNVVEYRVRSAQIKEYALERANGVCEYCDRKAPFIDENEIPFLEVHHVLKLSDDGLDIPENVAAICPNCHREAHYGKIKKSINEKLAKIISEKEHRLNLELN